MNSDTFGDSVGDNGSHMSHMIDERGESDSEFTAETDETEFTPSRQRCYSEVKGPTPTWAPTSAARHSVGPSNYNFATEQHSINNDVHRDLDTETDIMEGRSSSVTASSLSFLSPIPPPSLTGPSNSLARGSAINSATNYMVPSGSRSRTSVAGLGYEFSSNYTPTSSTSLSSQDHNTPSGAPKVEMMTEAETNAFFTSSITATTPINRGSMAFFRPANPSVSVKPLTPLEANKIPLNQLERSLFSCDWSAGSQGLPVVGASRKYRWNGVNIPPSSPIYAHVSGALQKTKKLAPKTTLADCHEEEVKRGSPVINCEITPLLEPLYFFAADMDFDQSLCVFHQSTPSKPAQPNKAPIKVKVVMSLFVSIDDSMSASD